MKIHVIKHLTDFPSPKLDDSPRKDALSSTRMLTTIRRAGCDNLNEPPGFHPAKIGPDILLESRTGIQDVTFSIFPYKYHPMPI